jgi:hypothetical protein
VCAQCGTSLEVREWDRRKFCGQKCAGVYKRLDPAKLVAITCILCDSSFQARHLHANKLCSLACAKQWSQLPPNEKARRAGVEAGRGADPAPLAGLADLPISSLHAAFSTMPEVRAARYRRYPIAALLTYLVCAMLRGARSIEAVTRWGREAGPTALVPILGTVRTNTPNDATISRLIQVLDRERFEHALEAWALDQGVPRADLELAPSTHPAGNHQKPLPGVFTVAAFVARARSSTAAGNR